MSDLLQIETRLKAAISNSIQFETEADRILSRPDGKIYLYMLMHHGDMRCPYVEEVKRIWLISDKNDEQRIYDLAIDVAKAKRYFNCVNQLERLNPSRLYNTELRPTQYPHNPQSTGHIKSGIQLLFHHAGSVINNTWKFINANIISSVFGSLLVIYLTSHFPKIVLLIKAMLKR